MTQCPYCGDDVGELPNHLKSRCNHVPASPHQYELDDFGGDGDV